MKIEWSLFKQFVDSRSLSVQWIDLDKKYFLKAYDGVFSIESEVDKYPTDTTELTDFETNYKPLGNQRLSQFDTDGANIMRLKAAKKGWSFWAIPIEFTTSLLSSNIYCKDSSGTDIPGITYKIYDAGGVQITVPGLANINLAACTKTVIDFEPAFDYEIIGGALRIHSNPAQDVRLWIVGAPDIPAIYGGSKEFASGINLKFMAPDASFEIDGRVTKFLTYDATTHQGKMRIIIKHPAGLQLNLQVIIHIYRA